jgi:hypothetical protein
MYNSERDLLGSSAMPLTPIELDVLEHLRRGEPIHIETYGAGLTRLCEHLAIALKPLGAGYGRITDAGRVILTRAKSHR